MKFYGHRYKISRVGTFYVAVIRGESCFEKNAFEDTENPHPPTKTRLPVKEYLGKYSRYRKKFCFVLKLFLRPILFHGKLSFDNLTYFKLYGNLKWTKYICSAVKNKTLKQRLYFLYFKRLHRILGLYDICNEIVPKVCSCVACRFFYFIFDF